MDFLGVLLLHLDLEIFIGEVKCYYALILNYFRGRLAVPLLHPRGVYSRGFVLVVNSGGVNVAVHCR